MIRAAFVDLGAHRVGRAPLEDVAEERARPGTASSCRRATRTPSSRSRPAPCTQPLGAVCSRASASSRTCRPRRTGTRRSGAPGPSTARCQSLELRDRERPAELVEPRDLAARESVSARANEYAASARVAGWVGRSSRSSEPLRVVEPQPEQARDRLRAEPRRRAEPARRAPRSGSARCGREPECVHELGVELAHRDEPGRIGGHRRGLPPRGESVRQLAAGERVGGPEACGVGAEDARGGDRGDLWIGPRSRGGKGERRGGNRPASPCSPRRWRRAPRARPP